jgi:hypothetical protein
MYQPCSSVSMPLVKNFMLMALSEMPMILSSGFTTTSFPHQIDVITSAQQLAQ